MYIIMSTQKGERLGALRLWSLFQSGLLTKATELPWVKYIFTTRPGSGRFRGGGGGGGGGSESPPPPSVLELKKIN